MIKINMARARSIAHDLRRAARDREFAPWDAVISRQIPGADLAGAEQHRQAIRERYQQIQQAIDQTQDPGLLQQIIESLPKSA